MVAASAAIYIMILFYSFLLNASTLLLFLISDKSGNEILVTQMGIYRNEKALKICVKKVFQ